MNIGRDVVAREIALFPRTLAPGSKRLDQDDWSKVLLEPLKGAGTLCQVCHKHHI